MFRGRKFGNGAACGNGGRRNREDISRELRVPVELRPSDRSRATNRAKGTYFLRRTELFPAKFITMNIPEE